MDILFIQRYWENAWLDVVAASGGLSDFDKSAVKYEIAKEVEWVTRVENVEEMTQIRLDKINQLLALNENDISSFDSFFVYRKSFFEFILNC